MGSDIEQDENIEQGPRRQPRVIEVSSTAHVHVAGSAQVKVVRGEPGWSAIYTMLGFALAIEATVVSFLDPLQWWGKLIAFSVITPVTVYLFAESGWFQNKLFLWKSRHEGKAR